MSKHPALLSFTDDNLAATRLGGDLTESVALRERENMNISV